MNVERSPMKRSRVQSKTYDEPKKCNYPEGRSEVTLSFLDPTHNQILKSN